MAVTPVRTFSPRTMVTWPTFTPATSVMAFSGPGGKTPGSMPRSRARGRFSWPCPAATIADAIAQANRMMTSRCIDALLLIERRIVGGYYREPPASQSDSRRGGFVVDFYAETSIVMHKPRRTEER